MSGVVGRHSNVSPHTRKIVKREFPRLQLAKSSLDTEVEISRYLANRSRLQDICRTQESSVDRMRVKTKWRHDLLKVV